MDRIAKLQIGFIVLGLFLIVLSLYVAYYNHYFYNYYLPYALCSIGLGFVFTGYALRARVKIYEKTKEQSERKKGSPKTDADIVGIIALIFIFVSLGFGVFSAYVVPLPTLNVLFLILFVIGFLLGLLSSALRSAERKKQKNRHH